jgi:hypothetical protein
MEELVAAKDHPAWEKCAALRSLAASHFPPFRSQSQSETQTPDVFCPEDPRQVLRTCEGSRSTIAVTWEMQLSALGHPPPVGDPQLSRFDPAACLSLSSPGRRGIPPLLDQSIAMAFDHLTSQECPLFPVTHEF